MSSEQSAAMSRSHVSLFNQKIFIFGAVAGLSLCLYSFLRSRKSTQHHDFESFLKQPPPRKDQNSIRSFIKSSSQNAQPVDDLEQRSTTYESSPYDNLDKVRVLVVFGTEFGFSQEIAEHTAKHLQQSGYWPALRNMASYPSGLRFSGEQLVLIICSTQGEGVPPSEARPFCEWLKQAAIDLGHVTFSVLALGDRSYPLFCNCGKMLDARFNSLGGKRLLRRVDVHQEDWGLINDWLLGVTERIKQINLLTVEEIGPEMYAGEVAKVEPKPGTKMLPMVGRVVDISNLCQKPREHDPKITVLAKISTVDKVLPYLPGDALGVYPSNDPRAVDELLALVTCPPGDPVPIPTSHHLHRTTPTMPFREALLHCYDLRTPRDSLLTWLLEQVSPAVAQTVGEVGLAPGVKGAGSTQCANGDTQHGNGAKRGSQQMTNGRGAQAQEAVSPAMANGGDKHVGKDRVHGNGHVDYKEPSLAPQLKTTGADNFTMVEGSMKAASKPTSAGATTIHAVASTDRAAQLAPRHVVDVLRDFAQAGVNASNGMVEPRKWAMSAPDFVRHLRPLQPRLYSISSSPQEDPNSVQATVAIVRYTSLSLPRIGVASTYLGERLCTGDSAHVYVSVNPEFRLPRDPRTSIIMIGPGTGIAPFRAFIVDRCFAAQRGQEIGRMLLFFGCRRRDEDYLYREQLEEWARDGVVELHTAFSREQEYKVYVQDRLKEACGQVLQVVQGGGHVYVCGDAEHMAPQVEEVLGNILLEGGLGQGNTPQNRVDWLAREGRYAKDVWQ